MNSAADDFLDLLDVTPAGANRFTGRDGSGMGQRIFGGQFLGQALVAAARTLPDAEMRAHSLHGYFVRAGDVSEPIGYEVGLVRDGRSFATRQVTASQSDSVRFVGLASFCRPEDGLDWSAPRDLGGVAAPGPDLPTYGEWMAGTTDRPGELYETMARPRPVEVRYANPPVNPPAGPVTEPQLMWMRVPFELPDDPLVHAAAIAYASDETLVDNAMLVHGMRWSDPRVIGASLDHALWFCRPARADRWLLFEQTVVSTSASRGLVRGDLRLADGTLVATATQEGLIRLRDGD
ncbi:MAG: thioesterase family protein [Acidimicrobiia bacterium]|nr:thioesterase family protein [Acidimicrobiia bacterium]